jgi:Carboxypeptidase regulatory-like domain
MPTSAAGATLVDGQVFSAAGQVVAGARVLCVAAPVAMADVALLTDAQGRFTWVAPAPGAYTLLVQADAAGSLRHPLQASGVPLRLRLVLKP